MYTRRTVKAELGEIYDVELEADLLQANRNIAEENEELLRKHGVTAIDVMGSTGSGKTTLIEGLVERLKERYRVTVFDGDLTTTIDSDLIAMHGVEVVQINTGRGCHLDANLVRKALQSIDFKGVDILLIENVGNLICPADFPLGSEKRIVVISVTEGPYTVVKHPFMFIDADVVVINKMDLAEAMGVDVQKLEEDVHTVNPGARVVRTNCRSGLGLEEVVKALGL